MKKMLFGLFVAVSAAPAALIFGMFAFNHMLGGLRNAFEMAAGLAGCMLGLGFFIFMAGLASSKEATVKVSKDSER